MILWLILMLSWRRSSSMTQIAWVFAEQVEAHPQILILVLVSISIFWYCYWYWFWYWYRCRYQYIDIVIGIAWVLSWTGWISSSRSRTSWEPTDELSNSPISAKVCHCIFVIVFLESILSTISPITDKKTMSRESTNCQTHPHCTNMSLSCYSIIVDFNDTVHETSSDALSTNTSLQISISCWLMKS